LGFDEREEAVAECVRYFERDGAASDLVSGAFADMGRELAVHAASSCQFSGGESATPEFTVGAAGFKPRCAARGRCWGREWVVQGIDAVRIIPHTVCEWWGPTPAPELVRDTLDGGRGNGFEEESIVFTAEVPGIGLGVEE
jgi:hypothetical protein